MSNFIGIDISGIETLKQRLLKLPREAQDAGVETSNEYMLDVMRTYPPKPNGKFLWSSDKQRKAVMAKLREQGATHYTRTQELRNGWKTIGKGYNQMIVNDVPYAMFVQDIQQIRGHAANGWMAIPKILKDRGKKILDKFEEGVRKAIRKLRL